MATTTATRTVKCPNCGRVNRVPAAAHGKPQATIPVLVDGAITRNPSDSRSGGN
ncbi:MAG TPA: hypothetical protein VFN75_01495 [Pseudonocardiaceae bacterium]|nr:hypothetical protein [Pseudonocardiaceae bacterium]